MLGENSPNIFETNKDTKTKKGKIKMKNNIINAINKSIIVAGLVVPSMILTYILSVSLFTYSAPTTFDYVLAGLVLALLFLTTNTNNVQFTGMKSTKSRVKHVLRNALIGFLITITIGTIGSIVLVEFGDMSIISSVVGILACAKNLVFEALLPYRVEAI